jgi:hypothetical protein
VSNNSTATQPQVFIMSVAETERARYWIAQHPHDEKSYRILTYSFAETGIGRRITVRCACGAEFDCTDYQAW